MKAKRIANVIPALTARTQFGQILRRVRQNNERFVVDKRGEPQAVIMSVQEYLRTFATDAPALRKAQRAARAKGTNQLSLAAINAEIKSHRRKNR
jgi:prevent-host-death family protein